MLIQNFRKLFAIVNNNTTKSHDLDNRLDAVKVVIPTFSIHKEIRDEMSEVHGTLIKTISCYSMGKKKVLATGSKDSLEKLHKIRNTIQVQKVIVKTLFKLVEQGCATKEEILNTKREGVLCASKIENDITQILKELRTINITKTYPVTFNQD